MIIIYGRDTCPYCRGAKELCEKQNQAYIYNDIEQDANAQSKHQELASTYNHTSVPLVLIDDKFIGGFDNLKAWINNQEPIEVDDSGCCGGASSI